MYECPNCASNLKYHISKKKLYCENCQTTMDPYRFHKEQDAEERTEYEVTVFTCPQCGGEIVSEDTTAATFCSFCGASTILDSRISKERRPSHIIPFSKTEADCRTAYQKMLKHAIFAPDALKDENHINKFRGIYMPYWVYSFEKKGPITFKGSKRRRSGDYIITKHYDVSCDIDAEYRGIAFDASSTFCDNLSNAIAPFDVKRGKSFTPAFLSGFYADTSDIDNSCYQSDAEKMIMDVQCSQIERKGSFAKYNLSEPGHMASLKNALRPEVSESELALFPVWFLSYRKDDRVAYAVVNGQTGKVAADLPVDSRKYLIGSLLLAIPIFVLLNLFFTLKPNWLLLIVALLALICTIISNTQISRIMRRERGEDDKGLQYRREANWAKSSVPLSDMRENAPDTKKTGILKPFMITFMILFLGSFVLSALMRIMGATASHAIRNINLLLTFMMVLLPNIALICFIYMAFSQNKKRSPHRSSPGAWKQNLPLLWKPLSGIAVAVLILIINPVSDIIYYLGAIFCMSMAAWVFVDIIQRHNLLSTRKLPQLNKRGGDENA